MFLKILMTLPKKGKTHLDELKQTWMGKLNENCVLFRRKKRKHRGVKSILYKSKGNSHYAIS